MLTASHLWMNIYILHLDSTTVEIDGLVQLFQQLPKRCTLLLEDVDRYEISHERNGAVDRDTTGSVSFPSGAVHGRKPPKPVHSGYIKQT